MGNQATKVREKTRSTDAWFNRSYKNSIVDGFLHFYIMLHKMTKFIFGGESRCVGSAGCFVKF
jgi:hypothetical protein